MDKRWVVLAAVLMSFASWGLSSMAVAAPASFPGAVGFGALATGGRGDSVYHVTNLNDTGSGSFRDAVSQSNRTVVFDVGGYVTLASAVSVHSNITIEGQTAPGDGVAFRGAEVSFSNSSNDICQYVRFRQSDLDTDTGKPSVNMADSTNIILNHCSVQFGEFDDIDAVGGTSITIQNSIVSDPIGQQFALHDETTDMTIAYSLFSNLHNRAPLVKEDVQYINNVVYNFQAAYTNGNSGGLSKHDIVNNYFITGPANTSASDDFFQLDSNASVYSAGNLEDKNNDGVLNGSTTNPGSATILGAPWNSTTNSIATMTAAQAYLYVLANAGASLHRDAVDALDVKQATSLGTLTPDPIYTHESQDGLPNGGFGTLNSGTVPLDTDQDGIPDSWEISHGLNPNNAADGAQIDPASGYSNFELYADSLVVPEPCTIALLISFIAMRRCRAEA